MNSFQSTALIPYAPPISTLEFIKQEARRYKKERIEGRLFAIEEEAFKALLPLKRKRLSEESQPHTFPMMSRSIENEIIKSELELVRRAVSKSLIATMNQYLNKHDKGNGIWYPDDYREFLIKEYNIEMDKSFFYGNANDEFFEKTGHFTFCLKEGKKASEALLSFLQGPTVADCGNAIMACYYKCILDILGKDKFNIIFSSKEFQLKISREGITDLYSPFFFLAHTTQAAKKMVKGDLGRRPLDIGDFCHIAGVEWYSEKHPKGFGGGWNVVYVEDNKDGNQLFTGHGIEKATESEIIQLMIECYNKERTSQDEIFIKQNPSLHYIYNKDENSSLKKYYQLNPLKPDLPERLLNRMGFQAGTTMRLSAENLLNLRASKNPIISMIKMDKDKFAALCAS